MVRSAGSHARPLLLFALAAVALSGCRRSPPPARSSILSPTRLGVAPASAPIAAPPPPLGAWPPPIARPPSPPPPPVVMQPMVERQIAADGGTVNGDPRGPRAEQLNAVVGSLSGPIQACLEATAELPPNRELTIQVSYRIRGSGRATGADVRGDLPQAPRDCIRSAVEAVRFPQFEGPDVAGAFPYAYRRRVTTQ